METSCERNELKYFPSKNSCLSDSYQMTLYHSINKASLSDTSENLQEARQTVRLVSLYETKRKTIFWQQNFFSVFNE